MSRRYYVFSQTRLHDGLQCKADHHMLRLTILDPDLPALTKLSSNPYMLHIYKLSILSGSSLA